MFDAYGAPALSPTCAALLAQRKAALREMAREFRVAGEVEIHR